MKQVKRSITTICHNANIHKKQTPARNKPSHKFPKNPPFERALVLLDLLPRELPELGVHVHDPVLELHLVTVVQRVVDLLPPDQHGGQLGVGGHREIGGGEKKTVEDRTGDVRHATATGPARAPV